MFDELKWLPKKDLMRYLSVSQRWIENHVKNGNLKSYRFGGKVYFDRDEIDAAMRSSSSR